MTTALSSEQRSVLETLIQRARVLIEEDLIDSLEGHFGIHKDGHIEDTDALALASSGMATRSDLIEVLDFLRSEGETTAGSTERLVRETAFTHLNRLIAVRIAEAVGILPETMTRGLSSTGFRDFTELAPGVAATEWSRFSLFVTLCADELARDVPALFDPRNPLLQLSLSDQVFARLVESISTAPADIWAAPDALGWTYQFFNTGEERREMRESSAPRTSRELAVRNQFFTPSYVVDFLVQNGLGAHLVAGFPALADELPLLVTIPEERIDIDLAKVSVLDPACGSGHFLLGAYDVLEKAWRLAGVEPGDAAPAIVESLWGIDIDPRATQIAQTAVVFRARRHCRDLPLPQSNVICARALPAGPEVEELIGRLPSHVGRVVRAITEELVDAPILGPLLQIEKRLSKEVRDIFGKGVVEGTLSEFATGGATSVEEQVLDALSEIADSATATTAQRLFASEANDAVRFVEAMTRHYTAVGMNPPFGEPVSETKPYLEAAYPWIPTKDYNLLAAFVGRGLELAEPGVGTCAAITSRAGLFLKTFETWREQVLLGSKLTTVVDLGYGVMEQALVEAAAYVITNRPSEGRGTFIRLLKETNRPEGLADAVAANRLGESDPRVFRILLSDLAAIPGSPVSYWMSDSIRQLFHDLKPLEGHGAIVRQGLASGDDFQFVRAFWEVNPAHIGHSIEETLTGRRWVPFAKGGEYSPFWSDIHLLVDWKDAGKHLRSFSGSVIRNPQFYFRAGLTWPRRTNSGLGMRVLPNGTVFSDKGCGAFPQEGLYPALGWLRSRLVQAIIDSMVAAGEEVSSGSPSRSYEVGLVQKLAWHHVPGLESATQRLSRRRADQDKSDETTRRFVAPQSGPTERLDEVLQQLEDAQGLDQLVNEAAGLDQTGLDYLDEEIGPFPLSYPETVEQDDRVARLYVSPIKSVIHELIEERGGSRAVANLTFVADRRVEVIAHGLRVNPKSIARVVSGRELVAPGEAEDLAFSLVSYLVGVSFGRWDVRIAQDPSLAPLVDGLLAPPARNSPGMLLGPDGVPASEPPVDYPLALPAAGILLDQPGHKWDLSALVLTAGQTVFGSDNHLSDALTTLMKRSSLPSYLRSQFFKRHLSMYSMSRRKAPIYWQLQVPSKSWGVWLYAPRLSREMLFAVVHAAEERQRLAERQIVHLQREAESGGGGRKASEVAKELDSEQRLAVELSTFVTEAERVANLGWEPDLDDGMVLNAAPLAELFPAWKEAAKYRDQLQAGKYQWSTVSRFAEQQ